MTDTLEVFISRIAEELDGMDANVLGPDVEFRKLENWSSMNALIIIAFINIKYEKDYTGQELSTCKTLREVYDILQKS